MVEQGDDVKVIPSELQPCGFPFFNIYIIVFLKFIYCISFSYIVELGK